VRDRSSIMRAYELEMLEQRIMLSAEGADALLAGAGVPTVEVVQSEPQSPSDLPLTGTDLNDLYEPATDDWFDVAPLEMAPEPATEEATGTNEDVEVMTGPVPVPVASGADEPLFAVSQGAEAEPDFSDQLVETLNAAAGPPPSDVGILSQNTSADTITSGGDIQVNDTVQLVYIENNGNVFGDNTIYFDTTGGGTVPAGANISITGDVRGTSEGSGGVFYLNAGTSGTIIINGNVGTGAALEGLVIVNAAEVRIDGNIKVDFLAQLNGTGEVRLGSGPANSVLIEGNELVLAVDAVQYELLPLSITTANNITIEGSLEVDFDGAEFDITGGSGGRQLWLKGSVDVHDGDLIVHRAAKVIMSSDVTVAGELSQVIGLQDSLFESAVTAGAITLRADTKIEFQGAVTLTAGDLTLVTNNVDLLGGAFTVAGALDVSNVPISSAFFRPIAADVDMNIGAPLGATTAFPFSTTDIQALADGWASITFGYTTGSTNTARIGTAAFLDPVLTYAGNVIVNGSHSARTALTLDAAEGNIAINNGALVRVINEQVNSVWGSSDITFTAHQGDILFNSSARLLIENNDDNALAQGSTITLTATAGAIEDQSATPGVQTARDLVATAAHAIQLTTSIANLWAASTVAGEIDLFELDGLRVYTATTADGPISIDAGDFTRIDYMESETDASLNTITVSALGALHIGQVLAGTQGNVTLTAEGEIIRTELVHLVTADVLTLAAEQGIGESDNPLLILANRLVATNADAGPVRIEQQAGRSTLEASIINEGIAAADYIALIVLGATDVSVLAAGIQSSSAGGVVLDTAAGGLTVSGNIASAGGPVTVTADEDITLTATVTITAGGGDIFMQSRAAGIAMAVDAAVASGGGAIAIQSAANILLGVLDARSATPADQATWGDVAVYVPGGWVRDHDGSGAVNIYANGLQLFTLNGIGQLPDGLIERTVEIDAATMAAAANGFGTIVLRDVNDLETTRVDEIPYARLAADGEATLTPGFGDQQAVMSFTGGDILLIADGALTVDSGTDDTSVRNYGTGHIAFVVGSLVIQGIVQAADGHITADASGSITVTDGAEIRATDSRNIAFSSSAGSILADADTLMQTGDGTIVLSAQNDITLGQVLTTGGIGLRAVTGSVRAAATGDSARVVVAGATLAVVAGGSVDGPADSAAMLITNINQFSLTGGTAGTAYRIHNVAPLTIDTTSAAALIYDTMMVGTLLEIAAQSDVAVAGTGDIALYIEGDGVLAANRSVSTTGAGAIQIDTEGAFTMGTLATIENEAGTIDVTANGAVAVGRIASITGAVSIESITAAIVDADPAETTVLDFETTGQLTLIAVTGIGIEAGLRETLTVDLGTLYADTGSGGIFVVGTDSYATNGLFTRDPDTPLSVMAVGTLTLGPDVDGVAVSATGDVVLVAGADLIQLPASEISAGADIRLVSGMNMTLVRVVTPTTVALTAGESVMGVVAPTAAAIESTGLLLDNVDSLGTPMQPMWLKVARLAGEVTGGGLAFLHEGNLAITEVVVATTPVQTPTENVLVPLIEQSANSLTVTGAGFGVFADVDGTLLIADNAAPAFSVATALPVLWQSTGGQTWSGLFTLGGGPLTLRSNAFVSLIGNGLSTTGGGDLLIEATGLVGIGADQEIQRGAGDLIIFGGTSILVAGSLSGIGDAALVAGEYIQGGPAGALPHVQAADLILRSSLGISEAGAPLITAVAALSAHSGPAGIHMVNSGALEITNLGFGVPSLQADGSVDVAFSGHQGGVVTELSGWISVENDVGGMVIDPQAAVIEAFVDTDMALSIQLDEAGPDGNEFRIIFEIVRSDSQPIDANAGLTDSEGNPLPEDLRTGNPPSTLYSAEDNTLRVYVRNGVSTMAEVIDAINAEVLFPGLAVLAGGLADGSVVFTRAADQQNTFEAAGGANEGVHVRAAGELAGGADAVAAVAEIVVPGEFFTLRIDAEADAGAAGNTYVVRLLDEGPIAVADGGRLNPDTNAAIIEWDGVGALDIYINFGYTTVGTVIDRINTQVGIPFSASLGGTFTAADLDEVLGDAPVLMQADLSATAILRPVGTNNDFQVTATESGPLYNGIHFEFVDDGSVPSGGALATFNPITNLMTLQIQSGVTTANQVVTALNAEGTFSAVLVPEIASANNGNGPIQATRFFTVGGAVAAYAQAVLRMVGTNNDVTVTATELGDDYNNTEFRFVSDTDVPVGEVVASYNAGTKLLELRINPFFTSAAAIEEAINDLTAPFAADREGAGTISFVDYPATAGGTDSFARANVEGVGDHNDFEVVADNAVPSLTNIRVFLIDDGTITDGSATVSYLADPVRHLIINLQSGATTALTVVNAINSAAVPMSATLLPDNDGSGTYHLQPAVFAGGLDAVRASVAIALMSGATVTITADEAGPEYNGVQVSFSVNETLPAGTAAAQYLDLDGARMLQLRVASTSTFLNVLQAALAGNPDAPFTLTATGLMPGVLSPSLASANEGGIFLTAAGDVHVFGQIVSETGGMIMFVNDSGDLTLDASVAKISTLSGLGLFVDGSFANLASTESPQLVTFGATPLTLITGAQDVISAEPLHIAGGGDVAIGGSGLAMQDGFTRDMPLLIEAAGNATINGPIQIVPAAPDADGIQFVLVKSAVDGEGDPLTAAVPVVIDEAGGVYTIYALPEVATQQNIIDAINALELNEVSIFVATLGRQEGTLLIGDHRFFITSNGSEVIETVTVQFGELAAGTVEADFAGTTLTITLSALDNTTVGDLLAVLNEGPAFTATTPSQDPAAYLRAGARDFDADYTLTIVGATQDANGTPLTALNPVSLIEDNGTFTLYALPGTATRLDLRSALLDSGLFGAVIPAVNGVLTVGDNLYYLNTGSTEIDAVALDFAFVETGRVAVDVVGTTLDITIDNVDFATGADLLAALDAVPGFIVYTLSTTLAELLDDPGVTVAWSDVAEGEPSEPLALVSPVSVTLPVAGEGVFAAVELDVEGLLMQINWLVPALDPQWQVTTAAENQSAPLLDDMASPSATLDYYVGAGVYASTVLVVDGVEIAIAARSAYVTITAAGDLTVTETGAVIGGVVSLAAQGAMTVDGVVAGGPVYVQAENTIAQGGIIAAGGSGEVTVISASGAILMSGTATTTSASGDILYRADSDIAVVLISSTEGGRIDITSGGAISDALANDDLNVSTSSVLVLTAQAGIGGVGDEALNVSAGSLIVRNFGDAGDIAITQPVGDLLVTELTQQAHDGWTILVVDNGDATFTGHVQHVGDGAFLVMADTVEFAATAPVDLNGGEFTVVASEAVIFDADVSTQGGDIWVGAATGNIEMDPDVTLDAGAGSVRLTAGGTLAIAQVRSETGVRLEANSDLVRAANDGRTNVVAGTLQIYVGGAIGALTTLDDALITDVTLMAATASAGVLAISELNDLLVGDAAVTVRIAELGRTISETTWNEDQVATLAGDAVLRVGGALTVQAIAASQPTVALTGNVRVDASGATSVQGEVTIAAGAAHFSSAGTFTLTGSIDVAGGTLLVESAANYAQTSTGSITVADANAIIAASGSLTIGPTDVGTGSLALTSGGNMLRSEVVLIAAAVRLQSGGLIGAVFSPVTTEAATLSASAVGAIYLANAINLTVSAVEVSADTVSLLADPATDPARTEAQQSDVRSTGGSDIILQVTGDLSLQDGHNGDDTAIATSGAGRISIVAANTAAVTADVVTVNGHLTFYAPYGMELLNNARIRSAAGDVVISANNTDADLTMADGTRIETTTGNLALLVNRDLYVANVEAPAGYMRVQVGGAVVDAGDTQVDFVADQIQFSAGTGIGALHPDVYEAIEINVHTLSARVTVGAMAVNEADDLIIGRTEGTVTVFFITGTTSSIFTPANGRFGIDSQGGGSVSIVATGDMEVDSDGDVEPGIQLADAGNLYLRAGGTMHVADDLLAGTGHITLRSSGNMEVGADTLIQTAGAGAITLTATAGGITQAPGSRIEAGAAAIVLQANGTVQVAAVQTSGDVAVISVAGSVLDNDALQLNIAGNELWLQASANIGLGTAPIRTQVAQLAARTVSGSVFVEEMDSLLVSEPTVTATVMMEDGQLNPLIILTDPGIVTGGTAGTIVVRTLADSLNVAASNPVTAAGSGRVRLDAAGTLVLAANVTSSTGTIMLVSGSNLTVQAERLVQTGGAGQIQVLAAGAVDALADSRFVSLFGNVLIHAGAEIQLGGIYALARVALISDAGFIRGAGSTAFDHEVVGTRVLLDAPQGGIGTLVPASPVEAFRTSIDRLAAQAGAGGIHVINDKALLVDVVQVDTQPVLLTGLVGTTRSDGGTDLTTIAGNGGIVVRTLAGAITLNDGGDGNETAVSAHGSGNVRISAEGANADVTMNADVRSSTGHLSLIATRAVTQSADLLTAGHVDVEATSGAIVMAETATTISQAHVRYQAGADIQVGGIAGTRVRLQAVGSILASGAAPIAIYADDAQWVAGGAVGPFNTMISHLAIAAAGDVEVHNTGDLDIASVAPINIWRVGVNGAAQAQFGVTLAGLNTGGDVTLSSTGRITRTGANSTMTGDALVLSAVDGIGQTGAGAIVATVSTLQFDNSGSGSVFLDIRSPVEVIHGALAGVGYLYLPVLGNLIVSGPITVENGSAILRALGDALIQADIAATRDLRVQATGNLTLDSGVTVSAAERSLRLLAGGAFVAAADTLVAAGTEDVFIHANGAVEIGRVSAGRGVAIRAQGDVSAANPPSVVPDIIAQSLRINATGAVSGLTTDIQRLDVSAGGEVVIMEADALELGRFGVQIMGSPVNADFRLDMGLGELSSVYGESTLAGVGAFDWTSGGDVTLATRIIVPTGDVSVAVARLEQTGTLVGPHLDAPNGSMEIQTTTGAGVAAVQPVAIRAQSFTAETISGDLAFDITDGTTVTAAGIGITGGSGAIALQVDGGDLELLGRVVNGGSGAVSMDVADGALVVDTTALASPVISSNAGVALTMDTGVLVTGSARLRVGAATFSANTRTGDLRFNLTNAVQIAAAGVTISEGVGTLDFVVSSGNLTMADTAAIRNNADGGVAILVSTGAFTMGGTNVIRAQAGAVDVRVQNTFTVGLIESLGTATRIESFAGSVLRLASVSPNITTLLSHTVRIYASSGQTVSLRVFSNNASVNDTDNFARGSAEYILINDIF
jgi:hypothetical protein